MALTNNSQNMLTVTGTLTPAQIKSLRAFPILVIPAPGVGSFIKILSCTAKLNYGGSNRFTGSGNLIAYYNTNVTPAVTLLPNALVIALTSSVNVTPVLFQNNGDLSLVDNMPMGLSNSSVSEWAGNAANDNTITYSITYTIITI